MDQITSLLRARGIDCTVEYPEYICICRPDDSYWAFGLSNPTWSGDLSSVDGYAMDYARSDLTPDASPEAVVEFILRSISNA